MRPYNLPLRTPMLDQSQRDRLDIVLVSPRNPLNIGAVARAMANFGVARLSVAAPYDPHWREAKSAVGAPQLLANAQEFPTLQEAIANCTFIAGTGTLTYRKPDQPVISLPDLAPLLHGELARGGRAALVFGPEKHGLTRHDLSWCHVLVHIPTDPQQPSMNLGQAAAVCLYELARPWLIPPPLPPQASDQPTTSAVLDRLALLIEETMIAADYSPASMADTNRHDLRIFLRQLGLDARDTRRVMGLFRRILYRLKAPQSAE
ncbi:RNA methyltransferase [Acidobacteria bacterium AB60]|nr:RNA methyltransferase [Acidobacteria bacterium AB60]